MSTSSTTPVTTAGARPGLRRSAAVALSLAGALALSACGGGDQLGGEGGSTDAAGGSGGGEQLVVGGATFTEMTVMENMYAALLEDAGYDVEITATAERATYAPALIDGQVDVIPEYAASMANWLSADQGGGVVQAADVDETLAALTDLADQAGLVVGEPTEASSDNAFYVTQEYSDAEGVTTLSDFAAAQTGPVEIAAAQECLDPEQQPFCAAVLEDRYGIQFSGVTGDEFGSVTGKQKVADGQVPIGITGSTDATLGDLGLVLLEDDMAVQPANNIVPVGNAEGLPDDALEALNALAPVLTTEDLGQLNAQVDQERLLPEDVARDYLVEKGLIEG
ncbi:glycine betaine ABC transporter substrate-binding protein [uncultured Pseudokineococcus sp.]|uniref:glycine betaine ABC transporter substrate-binding protein n=1 Tax=uncultured Pseudokineococcus sp. TaxID=1642928 RepID=UPI00261E017D|nr:glycine betaine ABC transporter substrate-binding protein [uncultured Pseudokineococcus sp.]